MSLLLFTTVGGIVYNKTGSLTPGTVVGGLPTFTASEAGSATPKPNVNGPKVVSTLGSGTTYIKTGSIAAGTSSSGVETRTTGYLETGSIFASRAQFSGRRNEIFVDTGSISPKGFLSGFDVDLINKKGSVLASTTWAGFVAPVTIAPNVHIKSGAIVTSAYIEDSFSVTTGNRVVFGRPVVCDAAEELYAELLPLAFRDEEFGWPLLRYCSAIACPLTPAIELGADWSQILDVDVSPDYALPWLAQLVGTTLGAMNPGESAEDYTTRSRAYIKSTPGFNRGTPAAMVQAIKQYLTGTKTVILRERHGGAYKLQIRTKTSETISSTLVQQAILSQKPAGVTLDYATLIGQDYGTIYANYATYQDLYNAYATWNGVYFDLVGA